MDALENEIDRSLSNGFWGVWFHQNSMLGDSILTALNKMKQTDNHQHSDGLLQECYAMTQKHNEYTGKYAVGLDMVAGKVWLQSQEALGSTPDEWERLLVDHLLCSMNPKLQARVAHVVDGKAAYYDRVKFAVQKKAEINFDEAKKTRDSTSKPKATTHYHFNHKKSGLPVTPAVRMVAPAPEKEFSEGEATSLWVRRVTVASHMKLYRRTQPSPRVMCRLLSKWLKHLRAFAGWCFICNKVGHKFHDEECEMFDPEFLNTTQGPAKTSKGMQAPRAKSQSNQWGQRWLIRSCPLKSSEVKGIKVGGKEEVWTHKVCVSSFSKSHPNPSPTDLLARKKHDAVPPQLVNADPLAQIIGMETVANVIINNAEACALLDSRATTDLMTLAYAKVRNFDIRPMMELSDHFVNLRLVAGFKATLSSYVEYSL